MVSMAEWVVAIIIWLMVFAGIVFTIWIIRDGNNNRKESS